MGPRKGKTKGGVRKYSTIKERESTFNSRVRNGIVMKWPHNKSYSPEDMASFGFYYDPTYQHHDCVTCYYCKKKEYGWPIPREKIMMSDGLQIQPPILRHAHNSPDCTNARILCARFECEHSKDFHWEYDALFKDPIESSKIRKKSFVGWPFDEDTNKKTSRRVKTKLKRGLPTSDQLADNGFYYLSYDKGDDAVTCLYCGVSLEGWENGDDVAEEHRKRNPDCYIFHYQDILKQLEKESTSENTTQNSEHSGSLYRLAIAEAQTEKEEIQKPKLTNYPQDQEPTILDRPRLGSNEAPDLMDDIGIEDHLASDNEHQQSPSHGDVQIPPSETKRTNLNNSSLKVDEHGLTYEEIPDEGYLEDINIQNGTPERSVEIPASSLNELSDFFIEPSASGPSTFFNKSRPSTRGSNKSNSKLGKDKEKHAKPPQQIPEIEEHEQMSRQEDHEQISKQVQPPDANDKLPSEPPNEITDDGDFGMDFNEDNYNTQLSDKGKLNDTYEKGPEPPSKALTVVNKERIASSNEVAIQQQTREELVNAIREEVRQEILKQMATINMTAKQLLLTEKEDVGMKKKTKKGRKKKKHHHHHHRKGSVSQKGEITRDAKEIHEKEVVIDAKIAKTKNKTNVEEEAKEIHNAKQNIAGDDQLEKQIEKAEEHAEDTKTKVGSEANLILTDYGGMLIKEKSDLKRKAVQYIRKKSKRKKANKNLGTPSEDSLLISGQENHSRLRRMLNSRLNISRGKKTHENGSSLLIGSHNSDTQNTKDDEVKKEEQVEQKIESSKDLEVPIKKESETTLEKKSHSQDIIGEHGSTDMQVKSRKTELETDKTIISLGNVSEGTEESDDDIILDNASHSTNEEVTKENIKIPELENANSQSTPFADRVNEQSSSFEGRDLEKQLILEMSKTKEDMTNMESERLSDHMKWDRIKETGPNEYCQDLLEASKILKSLLESKYQVLSEDMDGQLTSFIAEMPAEELQMSIKDWLEHRAEQAAEYVKQKVHIIQEELHANTLKAVEYLEKLPCESETEADASEHEVIL